MNMLKNILFFVFFFITTFLFGQQLKLEKLGNDINTKYDEITPVLNKKGDILCFTRVGYKDFNRTLYDNGVDLKNSLSRRAYKKKLANIFSEIAGYSIDKPFKSGFNQDIWIAYGNKNKFHTVSHPGYPLNNALPNSLCAFTPDQQSAIVINQFEQDGGMKKGFSISRRMTNSWSFPSPIIIQNFDNIGSDVGLSMNNDGQIIVLTLENSEGMGSADLFVSFSAGKNFWSKPINLGPKINSIYRETTPFLSVDNQTLYFSSNRPGGLGGNDIYFSKRLDDTWKNWTNPTRMDAPINSESDDSQPYFSTLNGYLYFTSKRDGSSDIFRVRIAKEVKNSVTVIGSILNSKNKNLIKGAKIWMGDSRMKNYKQVYLSDNGKYSIDVSKGTPLDVYAEKDGYFTKIGNIEFKKDYLYFKDYVLDLFLEPIEKGTKIQTKPIYFKRTTASILSTSYSALDELAQYLKENRNLYVRIDGHTDNNGTPEILKKLSKERAEAVKDYLVYKKFIKPVRLTTAGFGGTQPTNKNATKEERAKNRRVEVIIEIVSIL